MRAGRSVEHGVGRMGAGVVPNDTNGVEDVFLRDMQTGTTSRISVGAGGIQADGAARGPRISPDGAFVVFQTQASNLVANDTTGVIKIVLRDIALSTNELISVAVDGTAGNNDSVSLPELSSSGRYVIFASFATNLIRSDTNARVDAFVRDRFFGITWRVSGNGNESVYPEGLAVSDDGQTTVFSSDASNLVANDTNAARDVFVSRAGVIERVSVHGSNAGASSRPLMPRDANRVVFETTVPIDGTDAVDDAGISTTNDIVVELLR